MKSRSDKIIAKINIFRALNGRDMNISDYLASVSNEELAYFISALFCDGKREAEILKILQLSAKELLDYLM